MKFNTAIFLSICFLPSALRAFEDNRSYQLAYNFCITEVFTNSDIEKFNLKPPEEQANECVERLSTARPKSLEGLDLEKFKEGFFDGRYVKDGK